MNTKLKDAIKAGKLGQFIAEHDKDDAPIDVFIGKYDMRGAPTPA